MKLNWFYLFLGFLLVFVLFSRFYRLTTIPSALVHDELIYVMQAKALAYTGSDMIGKWDPTSFKPFNTDFAELPSILMVPGEIVFSDQIIGAKITHVLIGLFIPFLIAWLAYGIWKNRWLAIASGIVASVNPWIWQFSRMSFDPTFSLFFYLLGGGIILNAKQWWKLISIPILFLGFFEYQGLKLIFLPWIIGVVALWLLNETSLQKWMKHWGQKKVELSIACLIILSSAMLFGWYTFVSLPTQSSSTRLNQIIFLEKSIASKAVMDQRRLATASPILSLTSNRYLFTSLYILQNFFKVINPNFLFISASETANRFAVTNHGYFYFIDLFLVIIGIYFLLTNQKSKQKNIFFLAILIASTIPAIIATANSFTFRASLFYLLMTLVIGNGLYHVRRQKYIFRLIIAIYILSVGIFTNQYFTKYPIYAADGQFFSERILAEYVKRVSKETSISIYTPGEESIFNSYLFYNNLYSRNDSLNIRNKLLENSYTFDNLNVINSCADLSTLTSTNKIVIIDTEMTICENNPDQAPSKKTKESRYFTTLPAISDNRELYRIYNDPLCTQYPLSTFISPRKLSNFDVEMLSDQEFCQTWFSDLRPLLQPVVND